MQDPPSDAAPRLSITLQELNKGPDDQSWRVAWCVVNLAEDQVHIAEVWLPHSGFYAERQALRPNRVLARAESSLIQCQVRCSAEPGDVVENAFLILRVGFKGRDWRVFSRLRIERPSPASIEVVVEKTTAQPKGFPSTEQDGTAGEVRGEDR